MRKDPVHFGFLLGVDQHVLLQVRLLGEPTVTNLASANKGEREREGGLPQKSHCCCWALVRGAGWCLVLALLPSVSKIILAKKTNFSGKKKYDMPYRFATTLCRMPQQKKKKKP